MTMTPITPSDYEALSAYLDNELPARERTRLEQRLQTEPGLRQALGELRHTRALLRSQPRLRAPRNFTLTPQMAGVPAGRRPARSIPAAFPVLRLASVLATFFFIIMTAGSFYLRTYAPAPKVVTAVQQDSRPAFGMGGGAVEPAQPVPAPDTAFATEQAAPEAAPMAAITSTSEEPAAAKGPEPTPEEPNARIAPPAEAEGPTGDTPLAEAPLVNAGPDQPPAGQSTEPALSTYRAGWLVLTVVQVLLAVLALITGLAAFWLRRSARR